MKAVVGAHRAKIIKRPDGSVIRSIDNAARFSDQSAMEPVGTSNSEFRASFGPRIT